VKLPVRQLAQVADSGRFTSERQFALSVICQMRQLEEFAGKWPDTQQADYYGSESNICRLIIREILKVICYVS
jgi:hypothetical protein